MLNNYAHVLAMLQQMRQACDHPFLVLARPDHSNDLSSIGNTLLKKWKETHRASPQLGFGGTPAGGDGDGDGAVGPSSAFIATKLQEIQQQQHRRARRRPSSANGSRPPSRSDANGSGVSDGDASMSESEDAGGTIGGVRATAGTRAGQIAGASASAGATVAADDEDENSTCVICLEIFEDPVLTPCAHQFCRECIQGCLGSLGQAPCPVCRVPVKRSELLTISLHTNSRFAVDLDTCWRPSAKLNALMADLNDDLSKPLPPVHPKALLPPSGHAPTVRKAVVISQWTSMLDLIQRPLEHADIEYERLDGSVSQPQRQATLQRFADNQNVRVLLLSLRAGGVGLNLVAAQTVYLMDPWWNPAVEEQAINRVHRIGQAYPVRVKRFLMQHSVEDRIIELQRKKSALVKGALDAQGAQEAKAKRVEDLKWLFSK